MGSQRRFCKWLVGVLAIGAVTASQARMLEAASYQPQSFGASGSKQTLSCNTTANSNVLVCPTTGDFTVGEGIKVDGGGATVTVSAPPAPSVTPGCVGYQCVGSGSTSYSYAIAAVDSNGGLSQAGATTTMQDGVSQLHGGGSTQSYNSLTWQTVSGAVGYLIYRAIGSGSLTLMDVSQGPYNGYKDYGRPNIQGAVFPATPSASAIPGDLYGTIVSLSGGRITIAGGVPGITQTATVEHDDTAAFQAMVAALPNSGSTVVIPAGTYNLNICTQGAGYPYLLSLANKNNLVMSGARTATVLAFSQCKQYYFEGFGYGLSTEPYIASGSLYDSTAYEQQTLYPMAPAVIGNSQVTVASASDANNFAPGDYIYIRTGQTDPTGTQQPDAELNSVVSANSSTGVITLLWPLEKSYQTECTPLPSTVANCSGGGSSLPMGVSKVTANTTRNLLIADLTVNADVAPIVFDVNQLDGFTMYNVTANVGNLLTIGDARHISVYNNQVTDWDGSAESIGAKGVSDVTLYNNSWTALTDLILQANEGTTNLVVNNNSFITSGAPSFPSYNNVLTLRTVCHSASITNNKFVNHDGDSVARLDPGCDGTIQLSNNTFQSSLATSVYAAWVAPPLPTVNANVIKGNLGPIVNSNNVPIH